MSFLNVELLFGLSAVSVPVLIHLLNRRKTTRLSWAAMRFLRESIEANQRRLRIEDILLLLLRCLLLAVLAITLARPVIGGVAGKLFGGGATTAVVIVDSSYSMSQTEGTRSAFDRAKDAAVQLIDGLPTGSKAAVWTSSDAVNPLIAEPTSDLSLAHSAMAGAVRTDRGTDVLPALRRAADLLHGVSAEQKEIDVFTDGQASGWKQMSDVRQVISAATDVKTNVLFISTPPAANLALAQLRSVGELMLINRAIRFSATVTNTGTTDIRDTRVTLRIDGGDPVDDAAIPLVAAGESQSVSLFGRFATDGFHTVSASVPGDRLPADDTRTIAIRTLAGVSVLIVDGNPQSFDRDSESFYLQRLFAVSGDAGETGTPPVTAKVIAPGELERTPLDGFAAVIFADVPSVVTPAVEMLANYVKHGGGLIVFPGDHVQSLFYNEQLLRGVQLLPAAYELPRGKADGDQKLLTLQSTRFSSSIAEIWNDSASGSPGAVNIFKYLPLTQDVAGASGVAGPARAVLNFSDGTPAVMERVFGSGRVIQFAIPASAHWDDLPVHPGVFVPLIFRSLSAIVGRQDEGLNISAGAVFTFHPSPQLLNQQGTVIRPGESANTPHDTRPVQLIANRPTITVDQTDAAGAYRIEVPDTPPIQFAVQSDPRESMVQPLDGAQRHDLESVAHVVDSGNSATIRSGRSGGIAETGNSELWKILAAVVLALATIEMGCAWWFSRAK